MHNKNKSGDRRVDLKNVLNGPTGSKSCVEKSFILKSGKKYTHVYYHCFKIIDPNCRSLVLKKQT
jgi:hypothetical protein